MARWLTPIRTAGLALAAGLLLGLALGQSAAVREPERRFAQRLPETRARYLLMRQANSATAAWRTASVVDSVRRAVTARSGVVVAPGIPERLARQIEAAASPHPQALVVAMIDSADARTAASWGIRLTHALPRSPAEPCLTIVRVGNDALSEGTRLGNVTATLGDQLPGVCGFAAAFGVPGRGVADWLAATDGRFAIASDWSEPLPALEASADYSLWALRFSILFDADYLGCLLGRPAGCAAWLWQAPRDFRSIPLPRAPRQRMAEAVGTTTSHRVATRITAYSGPQYHSHFLADLAAREGAEAFRVFWTSDAPFDESFTAAFGHGPGAWVADWFQAINVPVPRELRPASRAIPGGLLLIALFVGVALAYSTRRTVSA